MDTTKIVIVGAVAGGASAAARARRLSEKAEIILIERGDYISFANCGLPYHIGGQITQRSRLLVQTPQSMRSRFNLDVRIRSEVIKIDRNNKEVLIREIKTGRQYRQPYDKLILSPGAQPVHPPLPGFDLKGVLTLRNMEDMDKIIKAVKEKDQGHATIIGGGFIGIELAEALRDRNMRVSLIEMAPQVMPPLDMEMASFLHDELRANGVELLLKTAVKEIRSKNLGLELIIDHGSSILSDFAILAIGVKPESFLAKDAGLNLGATGGIAVNAHMQTSDPNIYAVGDAVEITDFVTSKPALIPLAGPANRQGRIAADHILGRDSKYENTQGTSICKIFNLAAGTTGANEKSLKKLNLSYEKVYLHAANHAGYYPGAVPVSLKLLFSPLNGKILGAQAVGADGVDKRIDVLATYIRLGGTVYDLEKAELCYAPPYGSAKDIINYAGFIAANVLKKDMSICHVDDVLKPLPDELLLDVRTKEEFSIGTIPGAINIPLDQLRERMKELPDKKLLIFCQVGLRGYLACRLLSQHNFKCKNLTGGYKLFLMSTKSSSQNEPTSGPYVQQEITNDSGDSTPQSTQSEYKIVKKIDASHVQCPGPILKLKQGLDEVETGEAIEIISADPGFTTDAPAWCRNTGHDLLTFEAQKGLYKAIVRKTSRAALPVASALALEKKLTIVVFSGDFDKAVAAFIIANGAASMGYKITLFFTFWGLNILRKDNSVKVKKTLIEKLFGSMMPRGPKKLALSKMHMAGMGTGMIKGIMKKKGVPSLPEMIMSAQQAGVQMVACNMTMELMGFHKNELIEGIDEGGVASYLDAAGKGSLNLFI